MGVMTSRAVRSLREKTRWMRSFSPCSMLPSRPAATVSARISSSEVTGTTASPTTGRTSSSINHSTGVKTRVSTRRGAAMDSAMLAAFRSATVFGMISLYTMTAKVSTAPKTEAQVLPK